jgi:tetratricopeptide (TPR) repeat protein
MPHSPKKAIKLLQKALTFGTRGIQASKAYFGLGMRYEDMGNIELAIENYSKAIEAYKSFGMVHFWRGRLYYKQQNWIEARADFEKALSFSVENGPSSVKLNHFVRQENDSLSDRLVNFSGSGFDFYFYRWSKAAAGYRCDH